MQSMAKTTSKANQRKSIRFSPDEGAYALIDIDLDSPVFKPSVPALVFSESHGGCGLVLLATEKILVGDIIRVRVGNLPVCKAEVRWREEIDPTTVKIGLQYLP
jgi:hypothetical protein